MSIATALENLQQDITNARTAITTKGGTVTTGGGSSQLATDIGTIQTGITPTGNKDITATTSTQTGIDVTNYATVSVNPTPSESKTLTLGSAAPSTVSPSSGKLLSSVPVSIDSSVIKAENIAKDVVMLGITGTHEGGGGSGYNLYISYRSISSDDMRLKINGTEDWQITEYNSDYGVEVSSFHMIGKVENFKIYNCDHRGTYPDVSSSWARYRVRGTSTWTDYYIRRTESSASTITLTADTDLELLEATCLNRGTLISMYDGTKKKVEEIEVGDIVKDYKGEPLTVYKSEKGNRAFNEDRDIWNFEDGHQIITTFRHEFYNIEHQKMMYLNDWQIGEHAYSEDGKEVALIEHIHEDTPCNYFSLWCGERDGYGNNYFAGGLLAGNRFTPEIHIRGK